MPPKSEIDQLGQSRDRSLHSNGDISAEPSAARNAAEQEIGSGERHPIADWRFKLFDAFALLRRHFWLVSAITILVTLAAGLAVAMLTDRYRATAMLTLDQTEARLLGSDDSLTPSIESQVEIIKSFNIALEVAERLKLDQDPEFASRAGSTTWLRSRALISADNPNKGVDEAASAIPASLSAAAGNLTKKVTVRRLGMTDVIAIEAVSANQHRAAKIANTYAQVYLEQRLAAKARSFERAEAALTRRIEELSSALRHPESQANTQQLYQDALLRRETLFRQHGAIAPDLRIVAAATVPTAPFFPPRAALTLVGSVIGFILALVIAYIRDARSRTVQTEQELETITGVRNIGSIPKAEISKHAIDEITDRPLSEYSEAVRKLYFSLGFLKLNAGANIVLVTSANPQEGKATVALSLARAAAVAGQSVVVVDCNLRSPRLHLRLNLTNNFGLAESLAKGQKPLEQIAFQNDPKTTCKIISAGNIENIPPHQLFRTDKFDELLRGLVKEHDLVVLDVSAEPLADPLILMQKADVVLVVARSGRTTFRDIERVFRELEDVPGANVFTVLNFAGREHRS